MVSAVIHPENHPCFNPHAARHAGRVHLPVAPRCNVQCQFCNRKFDCVNETRPGVTSRVLTPAQALSYLARLIPARPDIAVVGIAGPGDPFANPEETLDTMRGVRAQYPHMVLCVASNGLEVEPHVPELARLGVSHVTLTINAVDPEIGGRIYGWVRYNRRLYRGREAGAVLLERQFAALQKLKACGLMVKVNSIIIPGVNDRHIPEIARTVAEIGADFMNCVPLIPSPDTPFEDLSSPDTVMTARVRLLSGEHMSQMGHCARCRADAAGRLGEDNTAATAELLAAAAEEPPAWLANRPYVAVASMEGLFVNEHLGAAREFFIYARDEATPGKFRQIDCRPAPPPGDGDLRWESLATNLQDCAVILAAAAGPNPRRLLEARGIRILEMEGYIHEGLDAVFDDRPIPPALRRRFSECGQGVTCRGTGNGCG